MLLTPRERPILLVNLVYIPAFTVLAATRRNYEFLLYVGVVIAVAAWILLIQRRVRFSGTVLWGLTAWGLLHMAGGNLDAGDGVLYGLELVRLAPRWNILRYDQAVHAFGFGVATLLCHQLLVPQLKPGAGTRPVVLLLVALMGCGLGAVNEILEFVAVVSFPETGVGGYENTLLDLVFNALGALLAVMYLRVRGTLTARSEGLQTSGEQAPA